MCASAFDGERSIGASDVPASSCLPIGSGIRRGKHKTDTASKISPHLFATCPCMSFLCFTCGFRRPQQNFSSISMPHPSISLLLPPPSRVCVPLLPSLAALPSFPHMSGCLHPCPPAFVPRMPSDICTSFAVPAARPGPLDARNPAVEVTRAVLFCQQDTSHVIVHRLWPARK